VFDKIDERIAECKIAGCLAENGFSIERFGASGH
jgi:Uri superfamily endonuclease